MPRPARTTASAALPGSGADPQPGSRATVPDRSHATILMVNGDDAQAALLRRMLAADKRLRVVTARSSDDVPDLIREHRPDLIFLDFSVSDGDGKALVELLRLEGAARTIAPLVVVAGDSTVEQRNRRLAAEVQARIAEIAALDSERMDLARTLARLDRDTSPAESAAVICEGYAESASYDVVAVFSFLTEDLGVVMGSAGRLGALAQVDVPLPRSRSRYLSERARQGPWTEPWQQRPQDLAYGEASSWSGLKFVLYVPLHDQGGVLGLLAAGTVEDLTPAEAVSRLASLVQYGSVVRAILLPALEVRRHHAGLRQAIESIVAERTFRPVFQPIVRLSDLAIVGYEALTMFSDGTRPDLRFAEAAAVGLGPLLEEATIEAALAASVDLPANVWLSINVSPEFVLLGDRLPELLEGAGRPIVLEITEHVEIPDYDTVRSELAALGANVALSIDDAGAGFASFRHVLELRPATVKMDIGLVSGIDNDASRQALVAGMVHFAAKTGCVLIGEGIETQGECDTLLALGVTLGQGYLFGQPAAALPG